MVDWPAFSGIYNGARNTRAGACLDGIDIKFQPGQRLKACDHPHESLIGKSRIGIAAANIAVRTGKPRLLHMALRFLPPSPSYSAGLEFELTGVAQSVELA